MKHPNATVGGGTGAGLGALIAWLASNVFHLHLSAEEGAMIAGVVSAVALFVGRHGILGAWNALKHGDSGP